MYYRILLFYRFDITWCWLHVKLNLHVSNQFYDCLFLVKWILQETSNHKIDSIHLNWRHNRKFPPPLNIAPNSLQYCRPRIDSATIIVCSNQSTLRRCCWCLRSDNDGENDKKDNDNGGWWRRGQWWTMMARMVTIVSYNDNNNNQTMTTINNDCIVWCREDSHTWVKWVISSLSLSAGFCVLVRRRIFGK